MAFLPPSTAAMNTISAPPQIRRLSPAKRAIGVFVGIAGGLGANVVLGYSVMSFYTRNTKFVPYDTSSPDLATSVFKKHNPSSNPPGCIDHAIKAIPYAKLPEKYRLKGGGVDQGSLTTDFCRGVWGGVAFRVQRRYLDRKYRALPGREEHLWDVKELERDSYEVGTKIVDHFEVVEHTNDKVGLSYTPSQRAQFADRDVKRSSCAAATHHSTPITDPQTASSPWRSVPTMQRRWQRSISSLSL